MPIKEKGFVVGQLVDATVVKNCVGSPWRTARWAINFERGMDRELELIDLGLRLGVLSMETPTSLKFAGQHLGATREAARDFLLQSPDIAAIIESKLKSSVTARDLYMLAEAVDPQPNSLLTFVDKP